MHPPAPQEDPRPDKTPQDALSELLPREILGWRPVKKDGLYTADTLYDLIDGGAEVYRALKVQQVLSRRYEKDGAPEIFADLFDMGTPAGAFGAYRHDMHEGHDPGIGTEAELLETSLAFWQDRYYVSLIALDESEEIETALRALGKAISARLPGEDVFPGLLKLLPDEGSIRKQAHFFHDKGLLDRHVHLGEDNLLELDADTEGLLARCAPERDALADKKIPGAVLLVIRYLDGKKAARAHQRFMSGYLSGSGADRMTRKNERWAGAEVRDRHLLIVLDALTRERGRAWLDRLLETTTSRPEKGASHEKE